MYEKKKKKKKTTCTLASWLAHWPLVLEVMGSIPATGEIKFRCPNMLSLVAFAGMTL